MNPKIADFGTTKMIDSGTTNLLMTTMGTKESNSFMGTIPFMSPEALQQQKVTDKSDVYSFGILLFELYYQRQSYEGVSAFLIPSKVIAGDRPIDNLKATTEIPKSAALLMKKCWNTKSEVRPTFTSIVQEITTWKD
jgi:serine/threonine protein kinase